VGTAHQSWVVVNVEVVGSAHPTFARRLHAGQHHRSQADLDGGQAGHGKDGGDRGEDVAGGGSLANGQAALVGCQLGGAS
jgi:hypothetical protein